MVLSKKYKWPEDYFSIWCWGNSWKILTTNFYSTHFFTIISSFNLFSGLFWINVKKINKIRNNVVCIIFVYCCALTTGRCNVFQHTFGNQKKSEIYGPYFLAILFLVTMNRWVNFQITFINQWRIGFRGKSYILFVCSVLYYMAVRLSPLKKMMISD